tara:strand:- start:156 stop:863 length:708 start_codon:yes stop_codon:yes gene_type:complete
VTKHQKHRNTDIGQNQKNSNFSEFWDFWGPIFFTFALYAGIRHYIAEARYIPSGSMLPGLQINDRLLIEKITYALRAPRRGEIVVFNSPYSFDQELIRQRSKPLPSKTKCAILSLPIVHSIAVLSDPACNAYIKRVIAIEGDLVLVKPLGEVFVNDMLIDEPYVTKFCLSIPEFSNCRSLKRVVPKGHVFVLGDNRGNSWDGRYWPGAKFLPEQEIIGRAIWRFWPVKRIGKLKF